MAALKEEDVSSFLEEAKQKGMYLVNDDSLGELLVEFTNTLKDADALTQVADPDTEPYKSKYKARELLDAIVNKLEATRTIALVEGKKERVAEMDWRLASTRVRLGVISWECEEPHNAQTDLELAAEFYEPGFVAAICEIVGPDVVDTGESPEAAKVPADQLVPPALVCKAALQDRKPEAMKCLNMLGILWAGRGQVQKSFLYLIAANNLYSAGRTGPQGGAAAGVAAMSADTEGLESVYTHNLFYLAQAYGQIGDTVRSSEYCYETLQRQYLGGFDSPRAALDWSRNCASMSDFYKSLRHYRRCALALTSAEIILQTRVLLTLPPEGETEAASETHEQREFRHATEEMVAELNKRWVDFEMCIMKRAFDREMRRLHALEVGYPFEDEHPDEPLDDDKGAAAAATALAMNKTAETVFVFPPGSSSSGNGSGSGSSSRTVTEFFSSFPVVQVSLLCAGDIQDFETARLLFLRISSRLERSKKHFVLDGYVTDHVNLLQANSKLFHYLATFEPDTKRKLAMESRRIDMLSPLLKSLNKAAFEGLHKQLSYELAEAHMSLLEIKLDKLKSGTGVQPLDKTIKKADMVKCNAYCQASLAMFTNFLSYYARSDDRNNRGGGIPFTEMPFEELVAITFPDPDESLISAEEVRPFLNAHFLSCRVLSKTMMPQEAAPQLRVLSMAACLKRYEWLHKNGPAICSRKDVDIHNIWGSEIDIVAEMISLLPAKIDRIFYRGESSIL